MKLIKTLQPIESVSHLRADFLKAGLTACGIALFTALAVHPVAVDAADHVALKLPVEEAPGKLRKSSERLEETQVELTDAGKALANKYAGQLIELRKEIGKQLPAISDDQRQACQDALAAQKLAEVKYDIAKGNYRRSYTNKVTGFQSAREKLEEAPDKLARAEMYYKNALAMPEGHEDKELAVEEARSILEKRREDMEKLQASVEKAEKSLEMAKPKVSQLKQQIEDAAKELAAAKAKTNQLFKAAGIHSFVTGDGFDAKLARAVVLSEATPYWLAVYAQQGSEYKQRVERLLANTPLLIEMMVADGAYWGKYGKAAEIYEAIQNAHPGSREGLLQRLALAVAVDHAVPIVESRPEAEGEEVRYIDPVARYAAYEKAYMAGELDPGFETLCSWSLRMVVNGNEPDEISAWGRKMLRSYRPDLISWPDPAWRYVKSVETEVNYTSKYQKLGYDRADLQQYQNILAVGGICGRRAFFGRFILRAFGVPTARRAQPGHAALVRWTPRGWVCCLGGGWGSSKRTIFHRYSTDYDFLASTQAREDKQAFMEVKRAQWVGIALGEEPEFGYRDNLRRREMGKYVMRSVEEIELPAFWQSVAMVVQNEIVDRLGVGALEAVGEDIGEANEAAIRDKIAPVEIPESERKITVDANGAITIPAAATISPSNNTDVIHFMPSNLGGMQLHYTRFGGSDAFAYTFDAPRAGKYRLTARLVTPAPKQHLFFMVNDAKQPIHIPLPYTIGLWGELDPVEVELRQGKNTLSFHRGHYFMRGVTIRDFTLTPVN